MIAGNYNILCQQGSSFARTIALEQPRTPTEEDPAEYEIYPLTNHTARMQVRRTVLTDGDPLISLTTENGRISINGAAGLIALSISAADTAALTSSGVYDLEIISSTGLVSRVIQGTFTLSLEVTR
jgi:tRNA threonylcarbamoyladenosine modification (KEOPS) complex  Pcc1 subunit